MKNKWLVLAFGLFFLTGCVSEKTVPLKKEVTGTGMTVTIQDTKGKQESTADLETSTDSKVSKPKKKAIPFEAPPSTLKLTTTAFEHKGMIPEKYTCDGENVNPEFEISGVPEGTKQLIFIISDPSGDEGKFVHWLVWDIDPSVSKIEEHSVPQNGKLSYNHYNEFIYKGPCPPAGEKHPYLFELYATDKEIKGQEDWSAGHYMINMYGHVLGKSVWEGWYEKK